MGKIQITDYITTDPKVHFGKPVIKGTRVPVALIVGKMASGMNIHAIMTEYDLTESQVLATLQYAADVISTEDVHMA